MLPIPSFFDPAQAHDQNYHIPNNSTLVAEAATYRATYHLKPASAPTKRVHLLVIDQQDDFSFPQGSLYVAGHSGTGSMDDSANIAKFIYQNLDLISEITCTLDTHLPYQVFYSSAHVLADGSNPPANTPISHDEYQSGKYKASPLMASALGTDQAWLTRQFIYYTGELEKQGRYSLYLWDHHCLLGSHGHKLSGVVDAARIFHAFARGAANIPEVKGGHALTENYSIFRPEVLQTFDGKVIGQKNVALFNKFLTADRIILAGEALSHCLAWSGMDLINFLQTEAPHLIQKIYVLEDCTSSVVIPGVVDFSPQGDKALEDFRNAGAHVVKSVNSIDTWPDF